MGVVVLFRFLLRDLLLDAVVLFGLPLYELPLGVPFFLLGPLIGLGPAAFGRCGLRLALREHPRYLVCLLLVLVARRVDDHLAVDLAPRLLHDVGQFVSQELPAARTACVVGSFAEKDVLAGRKGPGIERPAEGIRLGIAVHPDTTEIGAQEWLHLGLDPAVQRLAAAAR